MTWIQLSLLSLTEADQKFSVAGTKVEKDFAKSEVPMPLDFLVFRVDLGQII